MFHLTRTSVAQAVATQDLPCLVKCLQLPLFEAVFFKQNLISTAGKGNGIRPNFGMAERGELSVGRLRIINWKTTELTRRKLLHAAAVEAPFNLTHEQCEAVIKGIANSTHGSLTDGLNRICRIGHMDICFIYANARIGMRTLEEKTFSKPGDRYFKPSGSVPRLIRFRHIGYGRATKSTANASDSLLIYVEGSDAINGNKLFERAKKRSVAYARFKHCLERRSLQRSDLSDNGVGNALWRVSPLTYLIGTQAK